MTSEQKLNDGHYFLDKSQVELKRLTLGQIIIKNYMQKLIYAPIDTSQRGLRILDSAAADGKWSQDLRGSMPLETQKTSTFVATDITDIFFPVPRPEGITYRAQSMLDEWPEEMHNSFDLVHQRMALPAANKSQVHSALQRLMGLIKPGGWIQLVEGDHSISKGPAMADFFRLLSSIFAVMDTGTDYAPQLDKWLADMGFEDVQQKVFDIPLGASNDDATLKQQSSQMFEYGSRGLIDVARSVPTSFTSSELDALEGRIQTELMNSGGTFRLYCVWGRKPLQ